MDTPESTNPSYLLGQVVATATLLQEVIDQLELSPGVYEAWEQTWDPLCFLQQELSPLQEALRSHGKGDLLEEMKRIYLRKDQHPFGQEELNEAMYQDGYQRQIELFST